MANTYIGKDGTIRWYESTAPTPFYVEACYEQMDFSGPMGRPRADDILVLDRGKLSNKAHYVEAVDDAILEPVDISFSARLDDTEMRTRLREVLDLDHPAAWTVDGDTWVTTKADSQLEPGDFSGDVTLPAFADPVKRCTDLHVLWDSGSNDIGLKFQEVFWAPDQQTISEAEDSVIVNLTGRVFGLISSITEFIAGNAS
jgi:hypothetical protein